MAYQSWSVVYGEQPSAAKWNILGTNDASFNDGTGIAVSAITPEKLFTGTGTAWASSSYTPTFANTTLGNGTVTGRYRQIGKYVYFYASFVLGSTSDVGTAATVSLPVTSSSNYVAAKSLIGQSELSNNGTADYPGNLRWASTTTALITFFTVSGTYATETATSATTPWDWNLATGDGDGIYVWGFYEAA